MARPLEQYLSRFAEPEASQMLAAARRQYQHALVIPAYDEPVDFLTRVRANCSGSDVLTIVVVNTPDHAGPEAKERTARLLQEAPPDTVLIDRVTQPLPKRQGVGLARKIGTDAALALYAEGLIESPWLRQTDADAVLPAGYFDTPMPRGGAVVFDHRHVAGTPEVQRAADLYDLHMAYYVAGLRHAGSNYAYQTLGSTIAVHAVSYAAVRGFPKRNAAEDFYLLNKTAKVGGVTSLSPTITLEARVSTRVPFGTGPALAKALAVLERDPTGNAYPSYSWSCFELLAQTLSDIDRWAAQESVVSFSAESAAILAKLGFGNVRAKFESQHAPGERRRRAAHDWFDAFKTLRFVHEARARYPDTPLLATIAALPSSIKVQLDFAKGT